MSLLIFFWLARLLTPEAFGLVALANVFVALMELLLGQALTQMLIQRDDLEPEHVHTAFWTNLAMGIALTICGMGIASRVADLFGQSSLPRSPQPLMSLYPDRPQQCTAGPAGAGFCL